MWFPAARNVISHRYSADSCPLRFMLCDVCLYRRLSVPNGGGCRPNIDVQKRVSRADWSRAPKREHRFVNRPLQSERDHSDGFWQLTRALRGGLYRFIAARSIDGLRVAADAVGKIMIAWKGYACHRLKRRWPFMIALRTWSGTFKLGNVHGLKYIVDDFNHFVLE